ncbi:MAG TPA: hypothetical protein VND64_16480 [Pirellulales bacterium]|nr:hypothetical protein [Pirellulales bacterium]
MSTVEANELDEMLTRIRIWPADMRLSLATRILDSLHSDTLPDVAESPHPGSIQDLVGLLSTSGPPPTDEECEKILEEELMRKYL